MKDWKPMRLGGGLGGLTRKKKEPAPEPAAMGCEAEQQGRSQNDRGKYADNHLLCPKQSAWAVECGEAFVVDFAVGHPWEEEEVVSEAARQEEDSVVHLVEEVALVDHLPAEAVTAVHLAGEEVMEGRLEGAMVGHQVQVQDTVGHQAEVTAEGLHQGEY